MLILLASAIQGAASLQATGLDIIGSQANNTTIITPDDMPVEVNILGSTTSNIQIGHPTEAVNVTCGIDCWGSCPCGEEKCYKTPWDDFKRPLCYPWSSYIPTKYNRPLIKNDPEYVRTSPRTLTLGRWTADN
jgi:hypothetical protein